MDGFVLSVRPPGRDELACGKSREAPSERERESARERERERDRALSLGRTKPG